MRSTNPVTSPHGQIILLNGAPRSGKSSIVKVIQNTFDGVWINLGVDSFIQTLPDHLKPGIGLRPIAPNSPAERPEIETIIPTLYAALHESIAAHSRLGLNVVTDIGYHDAYAKPLTVLEDARKQLEGLPVLFVGVRCNIETIMQRRNSGDPTKYATGTESNPIPEPVRRWQEAVHKDMSYDLEVDTSRASPEECASEIQEFLSRSNFPSSSGRKGQGMEG